jgi:hypothetical protein
MPVYLALKNPLILTADMDKTKTQAIAEALGVEFNGWNAKTAEEAEALRDAAIAQGYDGVIYQYTHGKKEREYVTFSPTQIKSASGNRGTFDRTNPDIRESRNLDSNEESITIDDIESLAGDEEAIDEAQRIFLSSFPAGTKTYRRKSGTARAARATSEQARWEFGDDTGRTRQVESALGPFSGYETREVRAKGLDGREHLIVQVYGAEQIEAGLGYAPALTITVEDDGEISFYGPPSNSPLYKAFAKRGWAEPTTDPEGNLHETVNGGFWTKLTNATRSQSIDLLGDAHARTLDWLGKEHTGLHWKRTTGATGNAAGREGAIFFSLGQGRGWQETARAWADDPVQGGKEAREWLEQNVLGKGSKKTFNWWHRTVGSQLHKAMIDPHDYGRVFALAQKFIDDISRIGNEAASLAPRLFPDMDSLSGAWKAAKNFRKDKKDAKAIGAPVFDGTLKYARDEAGNLYEEEDVDKAGVIFTDAELRSIYSLTDDQIEMYREFRRATDFSMESLAGAEMDRDAGNAYLTPAPRDMGMSDRAEFYYNQFKERLLDLRRQLNEFDERAEASNKVLLDNARATAAGYEGYAAAKANKDIEDAFNRKLITDQIEELTAMKGSFVGKARRVKKLQKKGYAPLMRFGKHSVDVTVPTEINPETGEMDFDRVFFGMFETEAEARRAAATLQAEYPTATVERGVVSEDGWQLFGPASIDSLEAVARIVGMEDDAMQRYYKMALASRSALKRLIHRQGIEGYSDDVTRTLASFIMSNARASSSAMNSGKMFNAAADIPKTKGDVKDEAVALLNYIRDPNEEAGKLRGLLFMQFLGGSIASAAVNLTQTATTTAPFLHQFGVGYKDIGEAMSLAQARMRSKDIDVSEELKSDLRLAEEEGVVAPHNIHAIMGETQLQGLAKNRGWRLFSHVWGSMFGIAEQFNRETAFIAAYQAAEKMGREGLDEAYRKQVDLYAKRGLPVPSKDNFLSPYAFAKNAVNETQFIMSKAARPKWARGRLGSVLFTFRQFQVNYVELLKRMPAKERAMALATLIVLAGVGGVPFADDLDDIIDTVGQGLGYDTNTKKWKHEFLASVFGEELGQFVEKGVSSFLPLELSTRLGMGNMIPASGLFKRSNTGEQKLREGAEILGAAGGFFKQLADSWDYTLQGRYWMALSQGFAPKAIKDLAKGAEMASTGIYDDTKGRMVTSVDTIDSFIKAIGFQPTKVSEITQAKQRSQQSINLQRAVKEALSEQWARAIFDRNPEDTQNVKRLIKEWNDKNPNTPVDIKLSSVQRRVQSMRMDAMARFKKSAPKEMREQIEDDAGD